MGRVSGDFQGSRHEASNSVVEAKDFSELSPWLDVGGEFEPIYGRFLLSGNSVDRRSDSDHRFQQVSLLFAGPVFCGICPFRQK